MDNETAKYIVTHFSNFLTEKEKVAIRHISSTIKLDLTDNSVDHTSSVKVYKKAGWLTEDKEVLELLKHGFDSFEISVATRILTENKDKVILNYCPKCRQLARTPTSKQCRKCGNEWHDK